MRLKAMTAGTRVRLTEAAEIFDTGIFPAGLTGVVTTVQPDAGPDDIQLHVKLDQHFVALDEWDNELQVHDADSDDGAVNNGHFAAIC